MRRLIRATLTVVVAGGLVLLSACTGETTPTPSSAPSSVAVPPDVQVSTEPAPSASMKSRAIRADTIRRTGTAVRLDLTVATGQAPFPSDVGGTYFTISTNDGLDVDTSDFESRKLDVNSTAAVTIALQLPAATATQLKVKWGELVIDVPLPAQDGAVVWRPAPLRQAGLPETLLSNTEVGVVADTVRSEGMITEVAVRGWLNVEYGTTGPCGYNFTWDKCRLVEPDGTVHPLVGHAAESLPQFGRFSGVLRFLGELKPGSTTLQLFLAANKAFDPISIDLPSHADSPVQAVAGSLSRPTLALAPVRTVTHKQSGARLTFDRVDVLDDRVQVHIKAKGGSKEFYFAQPSASLTETSGVEHPLVEPTNADLRLKPKGSMNITLVSRGPLPPTPRPLS